MIAITGTVLYGLSRVRVTDGVRVGEAWCCWDRNRWRRRPCRWLRSWRMSNLDKFCDGPWTNEPDHHEWTDEATGYPCCVWRNRHSGHLCGYVAVPEGHILHGRHYTDEVPALAALLDARLNAPLPQTPGLALMLGALTGTLSPRPDHAFNVHGGITFAGKMRHDDVGRWWFGFDCNHGGDEAPRFAYQGGIYRDFAYVERECAALALQLNEVTL